MASIVGGIFVGGASRRMGRPKGLLCVEGEPLIVRAVRVVREAGLEPVVVGEASAYAGLVLEVPRIEDAPIAGPMGGLRALVDLARTDLAPRVVGLAVDMPYVDAPTLKALAEHPSRADVLLARRERWEPLCARWTSEPTRRAIDRLAARGERSLQALVAAMTAERFEVDASRLEDWDRPEDVR